MQSSWLLFSESRLGLLVNLLCFKLNCDHQGTEQQAEKTPLTKLEPNTWETSSNLALEIIIRPSSKNTRRSIPTLQDAGVSPHFSWKKEEGEADRPTDKKEEETGLHYTVKQHGTGSYMHYSVTGSPPLTKEHWSKHKEKIQNCEGNPIHCRKCLGTRNVIKWQFMQRLDVEWSGITLACSDWWASIVRLQISVWGGKRQREDGYYVAKRKMLCVASAALSKKCLIHYSPHSECSVGPARRALVILGPIDCLTLARGDLLRAGQWLVGRGHCALCMRVREEGGWGGCALLESYIQLKPGPGDSLETCTFERRGKGGVGWGSERFTWPVLHSVCWIWQRPRSFL